MTGSDVYKRQLPRNARCVGRFPHPSVKPGGNRIALLPELSGQFVTFGVLQHPWQQFLHPVQPEQFQLLDDPVERILSL